MNDATMAAELLSLDAIQTSAAALVDAIGSDAQLSRIVTFVRFEELSPKPLIGQLRVVLRASAIAGVHGQRKLHATRRETPPKTAWTLLRGEGRNNLFCAYKEPCPQCKRPTPGIRPLCPVPTLLYSSM